MDNKSKSIIYMKVGVHATETLDDIIARKTLEIERVGYALWGYGGTTCYPTTVGKFGREQSASGKTIELCMQEIDSKHFEQPVRASYFSADGIEYEKIPEEINVLGSRFALAIEDLKEDKFVLPLDNCEVAIGPSSGRKASDYIKYKVDKGCFNWNLQDESEGHELDGKNVDISLTATLRSPYAVFLK